MKLINSITKQEVKMGDVVTSFRGKKYEVLSWSEPQHSGSTGLMYVRDNQLYRDYYPSVFNCKFIN